MKLIPTSLSRVVANQGLLAKTHSPTVLFGLGIAGGVTSTVLACRATLKLEEVLARAQHDLDIANSMQHEDYSDSDRKKDVAIIYTRSVVDLGRLYGPAVVVGAASISALWGSHNILTKRNAALMSAYAAVDKAFKEYRARVVEKYGEDVDRTLRYETETITVKNEETGKKETIVRAAPGAASMYARFFDEHCGPWSKDPEVNLLWVKCQQNYANDLLHSRGHVFLNEVYRLFDLPDTTAGAVVGWIMGEGDNYIDFGVYTRDTQEARDFVNGRERSVLLDFNVDGVIFNKIDGKKEALSWQNS
jgi:hypothetical protein